MLFRSNAVAHPKLTLVARAMLVLSPEHYAIYRDAGWGRARIERELYQATIRPGRDLVAGAQAARDHLNQLFGLAGDSQGGDDSRSPAEQAREKLENLFKK